MQPCNHRSFFRHSLFALIILFFLPLAVSQTALAQALVPGEHCFKTIFHEDADGHDPANAYLLMLACFHSYENRMVVKNFEEFKAKYQEMFTTWGMDTFDFIDMRRKTGDTQVMIMSNEKVVIVVFRGSESSSGGAVSPTKIIYDWILTDFNFFLKTVPHWGKGIKVHRGFWNALDIVYPRLKTIIGDHLAVGNKTLFITGHSLGAGLVPLAAYRLAFDGIPVQGVYAYAGPRVGNEEFTDAYKTKFPNHQRWVFNEDIVTTLPYMWFGYRHVSKPNNIYENGKAVLQDNAFSGLGKVASHFPAGYLQSLYNLLPGELKVAVPAPPAFHVLSGVSDSSLEKTHRLARLAQRFFHHVQED